MNKEVPVNPKNKAISVRCVSSTSVAAGAVHEGV